MYTIKHRYTSVPLCEFDVSIVKEAAELGKNNLCDANLRGADLCDANLFGADLCGANLRGADLYGANLRGADLRGADLRDANLCDANLYGADLCDANLFGADLCGANLYGVNLYGANLDGETLIAAPIIIQPGLKYFCIISDNYMRLGCKRYTHEEWCNFNDTEISNMDSEALAFWTQWRSPLLAMCSAHKSSLR
jgi:hypothetical protein